MLNDEAAQCSELETLAAVHRVVGRLILAGHHKQLCCLPQNKGVAEASLEMRLFECFVEDVPGCPRSTLIAALYRPRSPSIALDRPRSTLIAALDRRRLRLPD